MKAASTFIAVSLLLTACSHRDSPQKFSGDAKLREQIVGTWRGSHGGEIVFGSDGRSSSTFTNGIEKWAYQMKWTVKDGYIIGTVTHVSFQNTTNHEPVGHISWYKVIHVDDHRLVYVSDAEVIEGGMTISLSR